MNRRPKSLKQTFLCFITLHKFKVIRDWNHIYRECSECGHRNYTPGCRWTSPIDFGWVYEGRDFCQNITRKMREKMKKKNKSF